MATTRLSLYNLALEAAGERPIDSLDEDREPRRLLDAVWTAGNGLVRYCLEQGLWNHAMRAVRLDASATVTPSFGWSYAFDKPTDFVRLNQISADETFSLPLNRYEVERNYFVADTDPIYMRYVSDDGDWGNDLSQWPETFTMWVGHYMACRIGPRLKNDLDMERLEKRTKRLLIDARSKDAQQEPVRFPPMGSWSSARMGGSGRRDRGSRTTLIG